MMKQSFFKRMVGFHTQRNLPPLSPITLSRWFRNGAALPVENPKKRVYLGNDEFTNFNESDIGIKAILLLTRLGYGCAFRSTRKAAAPGSRRDWYAPPENRHGKCPAAQRADHRRHPLVGIEPSAILAFRDEYPELVKRSCGPPQHTWPEMPSSSKSTSARAK